MASYSECRYYEMTGQEAVPLNTKMLPELLKPLGYRTAAIGKWNLGSLTREYTPTYRGFDSYLGYYAAATRDYWPVLAADWTGQGEGEGGPGAKLCAAAPR